MPSRANLFAFRVSLLVLVASIIPIAIKAESIFEPQDCSRFEGSGHCQDENGKDYDYCAYQFLSLEECQRLTETTDYTVGFVYRPDERVPFCMVLFDEDYTIGSGGVLNLCPNGTDLKKFGHHSHGKGRGYPKGSDGKQAGFLCYSCGEEIVG